MTAKDRAQTLLEVLNERMAKRGRGVLVEDDLPMIALALYGERVQCANVVMQAMARWPDQPQIVAVLRSLAMEIRNRDKE